jgi:hypothetical protein
MRGFGIIILTFLNIVIIKAQNDFAYAYFQERSEDTTSGSIGQHSPVSCAMKCLSQGCCETFHWNDISQHCSLLTDDLRSLDWAITNNNDHWRSYSAGSVIHGLRGFFYSDQNKKYCMFVLMRPTRKMTADSKVFFFYHICIKSN